MQQITVKRIVLASVAFVIALFVLISLCFTVVSLDASDFADKMIGGSFAEGLGALPAAMTENGFDLLGGDSAILAETELLNKTVAALQAETELGSVEFATYEWLGVLAQVVNIVVLVAAIALIACAVLWFFFGKSGKLVNFVAIAGVVAAVLYLAEGLLFYFVLQSGINETVSKLLELLGVNITLTDVKFFGTAAFWPLILIGLAAVAFLIVSLVLREGAGEEAYSGEAPQASGAQRTVRRAAGREWKSPQHYAAGPAGTDNVFALLGKLKEAYDGGILTREEFEEQKWLLLSSTKFEYLRNIWNMQLRGVLGKDEYEQQKAALFRQITAKTTQASAPARAAEPNDIQE